MLIEAGRISLYISFGFAVFTALTANTPAGKTYVLMLIFSLMHECFHIILLFLSGIRAVRLNFGVGGISMEADGFNMLSYKKTILCTIVPPVLNIVAGGICYLFYLYIQNMLLYESAIVNFILGCGNLLPFSFLDGGRTLFSLLCIFYPVERAAKICDFLSASVLAITGAVLFVFFISGRRYIFMVLFFFYCVSGYISGKSKG